MAILRERLRRARRGDVPLAGRRLRRRPWRWWPGSSALLELYRDGVVAFDQAAALGELRVRWTGTGRRADRSAGDDRRRGRHIETDADERARGRPPSDDRGDRREDAAATVAADAERADDSAQPTTRPSWPPRSRRSCSSSTRRSPCRALAAAVQATGPPTVEAALAGCAPATTSAARHRAARGRRRRAALHPRRATRRTSSAFLLDGQRSRLTQAALETLAVIAYRQPVTRARVSAIRGVNVDGVVRTLLTRGLIVEVGTEPDTGGGLYRTTELFLERLGLQSLDELPSLAPLLPELDDASIHDEL